MARFGGCGSTLCSLGTASSHLPDCSVYDGGSALVPSCLSSRISLSHRPNLLPSLLTPSLLYSPSAICSVRSSEAVFKLKDVKLNANLFRPSFRQKRNVVKCVAEYSDTGCESMVRNKNAQYAVVVYSKSWCPYCARVKSLFKELGVDYLLVELDEIVEEVEIQDALRKITGQSTVPNVFIGGKHIGGCDNTMELHKKGELVGLLLAAGVKVSKT